MTAQDNYYTISIDEKGDIYQINGYQRGSKIGIDTRREQEILTEMSEMRDVLDNYYNKLVELGAITPPKTAEEIVQETAAQQTAVMSEILKALQDLNGGMS